MFPLLLTRLVLSCTFVLCAPVIKRSLNDTDVVALKFMAKYGYIDPGEGEVESLYSSAGVEDAIREVQRFGGILETGLIDNQTLQLMQSSRCGVPDISNQRNKRFVTNSKQGWPKRKLTYFIANWSPSIGKETMRSEIKKAFDAWAGYGRLNFKEISHPDADIVINFFRGPHGDGYPFDGPGSVLAHAFFPNDMGSYGGDIHFDDEEEWKVNPGEFDDGVDFFTVAVHELGHSLGLAHSPIRDSIMNPYYRRPSSSTFNLGYDDILGMYELYIKSPLPEDTNNKGTFENENDHDHDEESTSVTNKVTTTTTSTTPRSKITFEGDDESVDVHKHHDKKHNIPGYGGPFSPDFSPTPSDKSPDGCSGNFDAVSVLRGELFVFKDKLLWRLSEPGKILPSYPVKLNRMLHRFPPSVKKIDAVYEREDDSNMVFFTGKRYWVFDGNDFIENSPKLITELGLPEYLTHIDAAMVWSKNKKTYFFSGDQYWRYNETTRIMDNGYPQSISRFRGVPEGLDSAFTWIDGTTYFFKDKDYWEFNNTWQVTEDGFPKSATKYLLNCPY